MKSTLMKAFLFGLLVCSGCDQAVIPHNSGSSDFLAWLQTMSKVRVTYSGMTNLHSSVKQDSLDPGNTSDLWLPREMDFRNTDSTYALFWQDSTFMTKSCFLFRLIDPPFTLSGDCGDQTLVRGVYHTGAQSISSLVCLFKKYFSGVDHSLSQTGTLAAPLLELESVGDDSVSFVIKNWSAGSLTLGYTYDEQAYTTYNRQMQLAAYDTLGTQYPQVCRVVFSVK